MEKIKNNIFFLIKEGSVVLWDYENHRQFRISQAHWQRIVDIAQGAKIIEDAISADLRFTSILTSEDNSPQEWGWDDLSWIFHQGTKNPPFAKFEAQDWFSSYLEDCEKKNPPSEDHSIYPNDQKVELPPFDPKLFHGISFLDVLDQRVTSREFTGEVVPLNVFSSLLFKSFAYMPSPWSDITQADLLGHHKVSPSAGGLHPFDFYIVVNAVQDIAAGLYTYDPTGHALYLQHSGDFSDTLIKCVSSQDFAKDLSFGIFIVADFKRIWWKYEHSRGYRHVLLDVGHQSQTFLLTATALQLLTWVTGAIDDQRSEDFLRISTPSRSPLLFVGVGKGSPKPLHSSMLAQILTNS